MNRKDEVISRLCGAIAAAVNRADMAASHSHDCFCKEHSAPGSYYFEECILVQVEDAIGKINLSR